MRAAASSIASGRPSRRTQISATAGAFAFVTAKSALTARARSMKSATASYCESDAIVGQVRRVGQVERRHRVLVLAREVDGDPARDEQLQLRRGREQVGRRGRRLDEVLEVVEDEQEPLLGEEALEALGDGSGAGLAEPERLRDRGQDERGVGDRRERDEEDALREVLDQLGGGLEREPGLARAARAGERQQAHVVPPKPLGDRGHLALAADQRRGLDGQVRRPVLERAQRRELVRQPVDHELREPLRPRQVLEPVLAEVAQRDPVGQLVLDQLARRLRDQHLPAVSGRADPRGARDVEAHVARRPDRRLAGVDPDPDRQLRRRPVRAGPRAAAWIAPVALGKATKNASPCVSTSRPPASANAARRRRRCSSSSAAYSRLRAGRAARSSPRRR